MLRAACVLSLLALFTCAPRRSDDAARITRGLDLRRKIGQMVMVSVPGAVLSAESRSIIEEYLPGGVILFGYNLLPDESPRKLIDGLQAVSMKASGIPLFISVDQEGGRVKRLTHGVTQFPGNMAQGVAFDRCLTEKAARVLGMQLRRCGVNMNLAPVLDVNNNPGNPVINIRSFGSSPSTATVLGRAYIRGLQRSRCIAVGKHFPGHGDTDQDSHLTLPTIRNDMKHLKRVELPPFEGAIDAGVEGIMTAHIAFPAMPGGNVPATISRPMVTGLLRKEMGFEGLILTDDMEMDAISALMNIGEAAVRSVEAGADIVLVSSYGESIPRIVNSLVDAVNRGQISRRRIDDSVKRIIEVKLRYGIMEVEKGRLVPTEVSYADGDEALLKQADDINRELSRKALYLYNRNGSGRGCLRTEGRRIMFLTKDPFVRKEFMSRRDAPVEIADGADALLGSRKNWDGKTVVCYHLDKPWPSELDTLQALSRVKTLKLVVLSTENPFPLIGQGIEATVLFTFSNTEESLRQALDCLFCRARPGTVSGKPPWQGH